MEIELSWGSLIKITTLGLFTYIIFPILMVCRDSILWWFINAVVVGKRNQKLICEHALDKSWLECADILPFRVLGSGADQKFYLNTKEVSPDLWEHQRNHWFKTSEKVANQAASLKILEKRIDRILQHYKLPEVNPVKRLHDDMYKTWCGSFEDTKNKETTG
ncbi:hypothetical protein [Enterovibrio norvegicus]|uniref:hypothetical protein n=1 Tax=Enterovibrio norvegicus TaxID=188144 RepID=UPI000C867D8C|nr:hypothetical protein [Enterovibrio norvegicus]PMN72588.1 hypothetical protein BCT27_14400 [Enterovibrio norvegicus]